MYATRDDLDRAYGQDMVDRLAIRTGDPDGSEAVARALEYAHGLIDARLSVRFALPIPQASPILTAIAVDLTIARLASGNDAVTVTDEIKDREKIARADLDRIADGKMNLGLVTLAEGERPRPILGPGGSKLFTRDGLKGL